jgi:hypothetical protein
MRCSAIFVGRGGGGDGREQRCHASATKQHESTTGEYLDDKTSEEEGSTRGTDEKRDNGGRQFSLPSR